MKPMRASYRQARRHGVDRTAMPLERLLVRAPVVSNIGDRLNKWQPFLPMSISDLAYRWTKE